ncbi:MAG: hypothetical protein AB1714_00455 [Acidobacteriota bacterium]
MIDRTRRKQTFLLAGALILGLGMLAVLVPGKVTSAPPDEAPEGILISDPIPGTQTDQQYYDPTVQASFNGTAGRDAFEGAAHFRFPPIKAGYLEIEYKEIRLVQKGPRWPIILEFSNGLSGAARNLYNYSRVETRTKRQIIMMGLCWMYKCDPNGNYTNWPSPTGADGWYVFTVKWDERTCGIYTGKGTSAKLVKSLPNKLGNSPFKGKCLNPGATKGTFVASALDIPGSQSTVKTYVFKNLLLYKER